MPYTVYRMKKFLPLFIILLASPAKADVNWMTPFVLLYTSNTWNGWQVIDGSMTVIGGTSAINGNAYVWPSTAPTAGQHLSIRSISGDYVYLIWGGDGGGGAGVGGGGSSSLAVGTGTTLGTTEISSPTAILSFNPSKFNVSLVQGSTAYVILGSSITFDTLVSTNDFIANNSTIASLGLSNGSAGAPSLFFTNNSDGRRTGFYTDGDGDLRVGIGGSLKLSIDASIINANQPNVIFESDEGTVNIPGYRVASTGGLFVDSDNHMGITSQGLQYMLFHLNNGRTSFGNMIPNAVVTISTTNNATRLLTVMGTGRNNIFDLSRSSLTISTGTFFTHPVMVISSLTVISSMTAYGGITSTSFGIFDNTVMRDKQLKIATVLGSSKTVVYVGPQEVNFSTAIRESFIGQSYNTFGAINDSLNSEGVGGDFDGKHITLLTALRGNTTDDMVAFYSVMESSHTGGTQDFAVGIEGDAYNVGPATVTNLIGSWGFAQQEGTGAVINLSSFRADYNRRLRGRVMRNIGLLIEDQSTPFNGVVVSSNNFQLYSRSLEGKHFVIRSSDGHVGIGTDLPLSGLHVAVSSGAYVQYGLSVGTFTGAGLTTCGDSTHALSWSGTSSLFGCQEITAGPGGGGGSPLTFSTGTKTGYQQFTTSPTFAVVLSSDDFKSRPIGSANTTFYAELKLSTALVQWHGQAVFDGGGSVLAAPSTTTIILPTDVTLTGWSVRAPPDDSSGSVTIGVAANLNPRASICASACPSITSSNQNENGSLTGWTTALSAGTTVYFSLNSATTLTKVDLTLRGVRR